MKDKEARIDIEWLKGKINEQSNNAVHYGLLYHAKPGDKDWDHFCSAYPRSINVRQEIVRIDAILDLILDRLGVDACVEAPKTAKWVLREKAKPGNKGLK